MYNFFIKLEEPYLTAVRRVIVPQDLLELLKFVSSTSQNTCEFCRNFRNCSSSIICGYNATQETKEICERLDKVIAGLCIHKTTSPKDIMIEIEDICKIIESNASTDTILNFIDKILEEFSIEEGC